MTSITVRSTGVWQGMNWIRQDKRLAIYLRDGCACAYCGFGIEQGAQLTLDHVVAHIKTQNNHESNLVTACHRCNTSKGKRSTPRFAAAVAAYMNGGIKAKDILKHVKACQRRSLVPFLKEARAQIASRGSAAAVLTARRTA